MSLLPYSEGANLRPPKQAYRASRAPQPVLYDLLGARFEMNKPMQITYPVMKHLQPPFFVS
jgi:hypothetical protein